MEMILYRVTLSQGKRNNKKEKKEMTLSPSDVDTATRKWLLPRHQIPHTLILNLQPQDWETVGLLFKPPGL